MKSLQEFYVRLRWLFSRSRFHSELADEMQFHIESRAEELQHAGLPRNEALARARREFGSKIKAAEDTSGAWQIQPLEDLLSDLRHAARAFRRSPGFAATAIVCLAFGIGANATIFNLTTSFLFSQPTCRDSSSLIAMWEGGNSAAPMADYQFLRDSHFFAGTAGLNFDSEVNWRDGDRTSRFYAGLVTDDFFSTLGIPFYFGRGVAPGEKDTAVLSYRAWRGTFGADPAILGRKLILEGRLYTVIGVLPANYRSVFGFGISPDIYIRAPNDAYVQLYARVPAGMTLVTAHERLMSLLAQLDHIHPESGWKRTSNARATHVTGFDLLNQIMPGAIPAFFALLTIVAGLVLLIACANVTSLLLARASTRSHELAIRLSLGAGRGRIVRHLLAESLLLSLIGSVAGLLIDFVCARLVSNVDFALPGPFHPIISLDWRVLGYSLAIALISGLVSGFLPALKAVRKDPSDALKQGERHTPRTWNLRSFLVAAQLAVSIVLLATALLFVHNLLRATSLDPGFDLHHTIWAYMRLVPDKYADANQTKQLALVQQAVRELRTLPGVESAAITKLVPLNDNCVTGAPVKTDLAATAVHVQYECNEVGPEYFHTLGIPILMGREFTAMDRKGSQPVAIVNETFARTLFGKTDPVGHVITTVTGPTKTENELIVGVAKDSKYFTIGEQQRLAVYEPYYAHDEPVNLHFLIRTAGSPGSYVKAITTLLGRLDPSAAIDTKPMSQAMVVALLPSRAGAVMLGAMGILGLVLAAIGIYGLLLYSVSRRTREIGLRVALGATPTAVLRLIGRHSLALLGSGTLVGLGLSVFAMRPLTLFLVPGLSTFDFTTFVAVVGVLAGVGLIATLAPATRALRVDAMTALRYE